jgi:mono/diheme cytochrome c family protein
MHVHAEKLDELNFALADGDLEAAMTPAYWLSRHETASDVQSEWMPFLYGMRTEAEAVETAPDLAAARAAAERINAHCQGCHAAVGIDIQ